MAWPRVRGSNGTPCQVWAGWLRATQGPHHTAHFPILMEYRLWLWLGAQSISSQVLRSLIASPGEEMARTGAGRSRHPPPQEAPLDPILDCLVSISVFQKSIIYMYTTQYQIYHQECEDLKEGSNMDLKTGTRA